MRSLLIASLLLVNVTAFAATRSLERELKDLDVKDAVPSSKLSERIYAVQERATPLKLRPEITVAVAENFGGSGFLDTTQWSAEAFFHITDRWAAAAGYSRVSNHFTGAADNLLDKGGFLPDVDYAKSRLEARGVYNVFYGKFRFSRIQAFSFDQYVGLGVAQNSLRSGQSMGPVAEAGFAFWIGQHASVRLGAKDYYYREDRALSQGYSHNVHGYLQSGFLF